MKTLWKTCLVVVGCCVVALQAFSVAGRRSEAAGKDAADNLDAEIDTFDDHLTDEEEEELAQLGQAEQRGTPPPHREPEAEILPANYKGVRTPGVDHMEVRSKQQQQQRAAAAAAADAESQDESVYKLLYKADEPDLYHRRPEFEFDE